MSRHEATRVAERLRAAGFEAWFAGGCVRDRLLGLEAGDVDVATDARPEQIRALFEHTVAVGEAFGVVKVVAGGEGVDVATFRRDVGVADGRHPAAIEPATRDEDVQRRDFTINGLLEDPQTGEVVDLVGGRRDLEARLVRAIGEPRRRFEEDALRLLRGVRFAARLGFDIEERTRTAMREDAPRLARISGERVRDELSKMLVPPTRRRALELLDELGLLAVVLPEVSAMHGVEQPPQFHPEGDVWIHTCLVLEALPESPSLALALGALLHDVGKPPTFRRAPDRIRFDGHVEVGARMADAICRRLRLSNRERERVVALVADHLVWMNVPQMRPARLRRLMAEPHFDELVALYRADCAGSHGDMHAWPHVEAMRARLAEEALVPPPLLDGRDVVAAGVPEGPRVGALLAEASDLQLEGGLRDRAAALAWLAARVRTEGRPRA